VITDFRRYSELKLQSAQTEGTPAALHQLCRADSGPAVRLWWH